MKAFARFVGRLPFAGALSIRTLSSRLYLSTKPGKRFLCYAQVMAVLAAFVFGHGVQVFQAVEALQFDSPIWAKLISLVYGLTNLAVIITQVYLIFRFSSFYFRHRSRYPKTQRTMPALTLSQGLIMVGVTLLGQAIFFIPYLIYR